MKMQIMETLLFAPHTDSESTTGEASFQCGNLVSQGLLGNFLIS